MSNVGLLSGALTQSGMNPSCGSGSNTAILSQQQRQQAVFQATTDDGDSVTLSAYAGSIVNALASSGPSGSTAYIDATTYYTTIRNMNQSMQIDSRAASSAALYQQGQNSGGAVAASVHQNQLQVSYDIEALHPELLQNLHTQLLSTSAMNQGAIDPDMLSFGLSINGQTMNLGQVQLSTAAIYTNYAMNGTGAVAMGNTTSASGSTYAYQSSVQASTDFTVALDKDGHIMGASDDVMNTAFLVHMHMGQQTDEAVGAAYSTDGSADLSASATLNIGGKQTTAQASLTHEVASDDTTAPVAGGANAPSLTYTKYSSTLDILESFRRSLEAYEKASEDKILKHLLA